MNRLVSFQGDNLNNKIKALDTLAKEVLTLKYPIDYTMARSYTNELVRTLEDMILASLEVIAPMLDEHTNEVILRPQEEYDDLLRKIMEGIIEGEKKVNYRDFIGNKDIEDLSTKCMEACKFYYKVIIDALIHCEECLSSRNREMHMLNGVAVSHIGNRINLIPGLFNKTIEDLNDCVRPMLYLNKDSIYRELVQELNPKVQRRLDRTLEKSLHKKEEAKLREKLNPNLYDYKDLNRMAKEGGFEKIRQKGDHGIFKRFDGSIIVIPQGRDIGKGLSIKIQKDMRGE